MDEIEALAARLDHDPDVGTVRLDIADLIGRLIRERRDTLGYWEKHCFAQALASLAWNGHGQSTAWLRLCLQCLGNALVPADRRDDRYASHIAEIDALTPDQLLADVQALGGRG